MDINKKPFSSRYFFGYGGFDRIGYNRARRRADCFTRKPEIRSIVFSRNNFKCVKCGSAEFLTVDHIIPVYCGGENDLDNLQTLCMSCNSRKSPTDMEQL